jgi:hypothetical protein
MMKLRFGVASLLLSLCSFSEAARQSGFLGAVQGTVVDLVSAQPLSNVRVSLVGVDGYYRATTDDSGRFAIGELPGGDYKVEMLREGYFWKRRDSGPADLTLAQGQDLRGVAFRLSKATAITGRVLNENGEPEPDANVEVLRLEYLHGRRVLQPAPARNGGRPFGSTNRRGEYRVYGLDPGEYYLKATLGKLLTYYPGVPDANLAASITVTAGRDLVGVDLRLTRVTTYSVSFALDTGGRSVTNPVLDTPRLAIVPQDPNRLVESVRPSLLLGSAIDAKYQISLTPGQYDLRLSSVLPGWSARTSVTVTDRDVEIGTLKATSGVTLTGRIRMADTSSELKSMRLEFLSTDGFPSNVGTFNSSQGQFMLPNVPEGNYWVNFLSTSPDLYIQSVRYRPSSPDNADLSIGQDAEGPVEIVLATGATVSGTARNVRGDVVPYSQILVFPARGRSHPSQFKIADADKNGAFAIYGLAPGEYRALAWEDTIPSLYRDPAFLATLTQRASAFTVQGSLPATSDVKTIP